MLQHTVARGSKVGISFAVHFLHTLKTIGHTTSATPSRALDQDLPLGIFFLIQDLKSLGLVFLEEMPTKIV